MAGLGYLASGALAPAYTALRFAPLLAGVGPGVVTAVGGLLGYAAATAMRRRKSKGTKRKRSGRRVSRRRRVMPMKRKRVSRKRGSGGHRRKRARTGHVSMGQSLTQGDVQYAKATLGRKPKLSLRSLAKTVRAGVERDVYRFQHMTLYTASQGAYVMARTIYGTPVTLNSTQQMPLYLFDLSALPYNGQGIGSTAAGAGTMALRLVKTYTGVGVQPAYTFFAAPGEAFDGTISSVWGLVVAFRWLGAAGARQPWNCRTSRISGPAWGAPAG